MAGRSTLVVLSPHPDDAVLAIGGLLAQHTRRGGHAVVVTVFAGIPPDSRSPIARRIYAHQPDCETVRIRRREDLAAAHRVQADVVQLPHLEALYRTAPDGTPRYTELEQIFSAPTTELPTTELEPAAHLAHQWMTDGLLPADADVLAPLGIGGHVDHRIVRRAAHQLTGSSWWRLHHYEDQPYAARRREHRWQHLVSCVGVPTVHPLTEIDWRTKLDAIACHASQIPLLWPNGQPFQHELRAYAEKVGAGTFAERTWSLGPPVGSV